VKGKKTEKNNGAATEHVDSMCIPAEGHKTNWQSIEATYELEKVDQAKNCLSQSKDDQKTKRKKKMEINKLKYAALKAAIG
jgi:hypothetical protein